MSKIATDGPHLVAIASPQPESRSMPGGLRFLVSRREQPPTQITRPSRSDAPDSDDGWGSPRQIFGVLATKSGRGKICDERDPKPPSR